MFGEVHLTRHRPEERLIPGETLRLHKKATVLASTREKAISEYFRIKLFKSSEVLRWEGIQG